MLVSVGWTGGVGGRRVYLFDYAENWFKASERCRSKCRELLTITTPEENEETQAFLRNKAVHSAWIAATDLGEEGVFIWSTSGKRVEKKYWAINAKDLYGQAADCVYVTLHNPTTESWSYDDCDGAYHGICRETSTCR